MALTGSNAAINKLQSVLTDLGLDKVGLPTIAVVGAQSSGKSSVLEAIDVRLLDLHSLHCTEQLRLPVGSPSVASAAAATAPAMAAARALASSLRRRFSSRFQAAR